MNKNIIKCGAIGGGSMESAMYLGAFTARVQQAAARKAAVSSSAKPPSFSSTTATKNANALARALVGKITPKPSATVIPLTSAENRAALARTLAN